MFRYQLSWLSGAFVWWHVLCLWYSVSGVFLECQIILLKNKDIRRDSKSLQPGNVVQSLWSKSLTFKSQRTEKKHLCKWIWFPFPYALEVSLNGIFIAFISVVFLMDTSFSSCRGTRFCLWDKFFVRLNFANTENSAKQQIICIYNFSASHSSLLDQQFTYSC